MTSSDNWRLYETESKRAGNWEPWTDKEYILEHSPKSSLIDEEKNVFSKFQKLNLYNQLIMNNNKWSH